MFKRKPLAQRRAESRARAYAARDEWAAVFDREIVDGDVDKAAEALIEFRTIERNHGLTPRRKPGKL